MITRCMVVIGHVDHGKTALVRALTGMETDRAPEERARGLSISPGFAHHSYPEGTLDLIDAPGHADFIAAMVRGASGAQGALLVVSAVEGLCAQTHEHLKIARLLGITGGVIAVSKSDLLAPADHTSCLHRLRTALAGSVLAQAPMVLCSAHRGAGLADLHALLRAQLALPAPEDGPLHSHLPVDRAFTRTGHGTVVTGTLAGGPLEIGAQVMIQPAGIPATIRGLQARGQSRACVQAGERVAVNLRGVALEDVPRGAVITAGGGGESMYFDVQLQAPQVRHMDQLRVLFGASSAVATVRLVGDGYAQLRFAAPQFAFAGQRAVLRRLSPAQTLGGALILDPQAPAQRKGGKERAAVLAAAAAGDRVTIARTLCNAGRGMALSADIARLSRQPEGALGGTLEGAFVDLGHGAVAPADVLETVQADVLRSLADYHSAHPLRSHAPSAACLPQHLEPALSARVVQDLQASGAVHRHDGGFALSTHDPVTQMTENQRDRMAQIDDNHRAAGLTPAPAADPQSEDAALAALLVQSGALVMLQNVALGQALVFHRDALAAAAQTLHAAYPPPALFTTSQARTALATSRRVIVPVLEHFDATGTTTRSRDQRQMAQGYPVPKAASAR